MSYETFKVLGADVFFLLMRRIHVESMLVVPDSYSSDLDSQLKINLVFV